MSEEILNAAILKLQAMALESYGIIKDEYHAAATEGVSDRIATQALRLAQIEGAAITLQQYSEQIMKKVMPVGDPLAPSTPSISQEELNARSPTFRKAQAEAPKIKKTRTKKKNRDES